MTDLPSDEEEVAVTFIERADQWVPSERFKLVMFTAMVLGLALLCALNIGGFIDRANTREMVREEREWVREVVDFQMAYIDRRECIDARADDYRLVEQRYLESALTGPHEGELPIDVLRGEWLDKFFKVNGARNPELKGACPAVPLKPVPPG